MKKKGALALAAIAVLLCAGLLLRFGDPCCKLAGRSDVFSKPQIKDALTLVEKRLSDNETIRSVVDVRFSQTASDAFLDGWAAGKAAGVTKGNSIVVFADFFTAKNSGAFNPNDLYTGFGFPLQMQEDGQWTIVEGGSGYS